MPVIDTSKRYHHSNYAYAELVFDNILPSEGVSINNSVSVLLGLKNLSFAIHKEIEYYSIIGSGGHPFGVPEKKSFIIEGGFERGIASRQNLIEKQLFRSALSTFYNSNSLFFPSENDSNLENRSSYDTGLYTEDGNLSMNIYLFKDERTGKNHRFKLDNLTITKYGVNIVNNNFVLNNVSFKAGNIEYINKI